MGGFELDDYMARRPEQLHATVFATALCYAAAGLHQHTATEPLWRFQHGSGHG